MAGFKFWSSSVWGLLPEPLLLEVVEFWFPPIINAELTWEVSISVFLSLKNAYLISLSSASVHLFFFYLRTGSADQGKYK